MTLEAKSRITITDNMRLWTIALVAARKRNIEQNKDLGLSDTLINMLSIADASKDIELDPEEAAAVRQLLTEGRLEELAI